MSNPHPRLADGLQHRILLLMAFLVIFSFAGISGLTWSDDETSLRSHVAVKIDTATILLRQKILIHERQGHPDEALRELFRQTLIQVPEFAYLAVMNESQKLLIEAGVRPPGLADLTPRTNNQIAGNQDIRFIKIDTDTKGRKLFVLVGVERDTLRLRPLDHLPVLLTGLFGMIGVGYMILNSLLESCFYAPFRSILGLMGRINAGDFRVQLTPASGTLFGTLTEALNSFVTRVNGHFTVMSLLASDLEADSNPDNQQSRKRLGAHMAQLLNRFHFADGGQIPALIIGSATHTRLPLFLLAFAETLTYAFLPNYVAGFHSLETGYDIEVFMALPITAFFGASTLASALSEYWISRSTLKSVLMMGGGLCFAGYAGTALSTTYESLIIFRVVSGWGIGTVIASCQAHVTRFSAEENFSENQNAFFQPLLSGGVIGVSFGGLLANNIGFSEIFTIAAITALLTTVLTAITVDNFPNSRPSSSSNKVLEALPSLFTNFRFVLFASLAVLPSRIFLGGFLFFLIPVYLFEFDLGFMGIGWVLAAVLLVIFIMTPPMARLADKFGLTVLSIFAGLVITGAITISVIQWQNTLTVIAIAIAVGIGHALILAPSLAALPKLCASELSATTPVSILTVYRSVEGIGITLGPLAAAVLAKQVGYAQTIFYLGCASLVLAVLFGTTFAILRLRPDAAESGPLS